MVDNDLASGHGHDGWGLRKFVTNGEHLKPGAAKEAVTRWLIRPEFYEEWLPRFVAAYAQSDPSCSDAVSEDCMGQKGQEISRSLSNVFSSAGKDRHLEDSVNTIEEKFAVAADNLHELRDIILDAVQTLSSPRARADKIGEGEQMSDEAKLRLRLRVQIRLRAVVISCLNRLWQSGKGTEILSAALEKVRTMIARFEKSGRHVVDAAAGEQWDQLKRLVNEIDEEMNPHRRDGSKTIKVVEKALIHFGGRATSKQIRCFIEEHPEVLDECGVKLNMATSGRRLEAKWVTTLGACLAENFCRKRCEHPSEKGCNKVMYILQRLPGRGEVGSGAYATRKRQTRGSSVDNSIKKRPARSEGE